METTKSGRKKKRDSVYDRTQIFNGQLEETLEKLREIWNRVGLPDLARGERLGTVYLHLKSLLDEMVTEEEGMAEELEQKVANYRKEGAELSRDLALPAFQEPSALSIIDLEEAHRRETERLRAEKGSRLKELGALRATEEKLAARLHQRPFLLDNPAAPVPTRHDLDQLAEHVENTRKLLEKRAAAFGMGKREIVGKMRRMNYVPNAPFERAVVSEPEEEFPLSAPNMDALAGLLDQISEKYEEHLRCVRRRIEDVRGELVQWWDLCHVSEAERQSLPPVTEEDFKEEDLDAYRAGIAKWRGYYEARQQVLEQVTAWEKAWREKVDYDETPVDYTNRGGNLQKHLDRKKQLERVLRTTRGSVEEAYAEWRRGHPGEELLVNGLPPLQHLDRVLKDFEEQQAREKQEKERMKRIQLKTETLYGTPSKVGGVRTRPPSPGRNPVTTPASPGGGRKAGGSVKRAAPYEQGGSGKTPVGPSLRPPGLPTGRQAAGGAPGGGTVISRSPVSRPPMIEVQPTDELGDYVDFQSAINSKSTESRSTFISAGSTNTTAENPPSKIPRRQ